MFVEDAFSFLFVFILSPAGSSGASCPPGWTEYAEQNICLQSSTKTMLWADAQKYCQALKGNLAMIQTEDKSRMVANTRRSRLYHHWVGSSDVDGDGLFEYANGSKVVGNEFSLLGIPEDSTRLLKLANTCGFLKYLKEGMSYGTCYYRYYFVCEMSLSPPKKEPIYQTKCEPDRCHCRKEDWQYFAAGDTFITVNRVAHDFVTSMGLCARLGGHLLTIRGVDKENFVRGLTSWWHEKSLFYWLGLSTLKAATWHWDDGKKLDSSVYTHWFREYKPERKESCVGVIWDYDAKWRDTFCTSSYYHICEARKPCNSNVTMVVNGMVKNGVRANITAVRGTEIEMWCSIGGYVGPGTKAIILCDWDALDQQDSQAKLFVIDVPMHMNKCTCQATFKGELRDETHITIFVLTRPQLHRRDRNMKRFSLFEGETKAVYFHILANPRPEIRRLTRSVKPLTTPQENARIIEDRQKVLEYRVAMIVTSYTQDEAGLYKIVVGNDIGELQLTFILSGYNATVDTPQVINVTNMGVLVFTLVFILMLLGGLFLSVGIAGDGMGDDSTTYSDEFSSSEWETEEEESDSEYTSDSDSLASFHFDDDTSDDDDDDSSDDSYTSIYTDISDTESDDPDHISKVLTGIKRRYSASQASIRASRSAQFSNIDF